MLLEKDLNVLKLEKKDPDRAQKVDAKNYIELSQDKYAFKEKCRELEEKLSNLAAVQEALEKDLAEERAKNPRMEDH